MVFLMWLAFTIDLSFFELSSYGIRPRTIPGLIGILAAPLLHGNIPHLISNTFPLLFLGTTLFFFYDRIAKYVFYHVYVVTGLLVWIFARPSIHIGASGLIYGLASFLIFFGLFRRDIRSLVISLVIIFFYGTIFYGVLPTQPGVSWESHLMGAIVGGWNALYFSKIRRVSNL